MSSGLSVNENVMARTQLSCLSLHFISDVFCAYSNRNTHNHTLLTIARHQRKQNELLSSLKSGIFFSVFNVYSWTISCWGFYFLTWSPDKQFFTNSSLKIGLILKTAGAPTFTPSVFIWHWGAAARGEKMESRKVNTPYILFVMVSEE